MCETNALDATPLHYASLGGHATVVALLLGAGADADAVDSSGVTPLHAAALAPTPEAALSVGRVLVAAGAGVDAADEDGDACLAAACRWGRASLAAALLDAGADVDAVSDRKWTALHVASAHGRSACAALLLARGANPLLRTEEGDTPADLAKDAETRATLREVSDAAR